MDEFVELIGRLSSEQRQELMRIILEMLSHYKKIISPYKQKSLPCAEGAIFVSCCNA